MTSRTFIKLQRCEGTLGDYLAKLEDSGSSMEALLFVEIMIQILHGVCHCQERKVVHRDLKESNSTSQLIIYSLLALFVYGTCSCHPEHRSKMRWLISDFGFSAQNLNSDSFVVSYQGRGTPRYRAPELLRSSDPKVCRRSDTWSIGCILFKLATTNKRFAFQSDHDVTDFDLRPGRAAPKLDVTDNVNLQQATSCPTTGRLIPLWEQINHILERCFTREPEYRATVVELKERFESIWAVLTQNQPQQIIAI